MTEPWLNFAVVIFAQLLFFIAHAYYAKKLSDMPRILGLGVCIGVVMGLLYDLVLGKFLGLASYTLGFGAFFLIVNGALSYGLFAASTLLMQHARLRYFFPWIIVLIAVYEITNHFFRVWTWEFTHLLVYLPPIEFLLILLVGYFGGAMFVAVLSYAFLGCRFFFIDNLLKK